MLFFNLRLMNDYINYFDGLVTIKIAGVNSLDESVYIQFPWLRKAEFVENDLRLHEARYFLDSFSKLPKNDNSITFYCHAKGVSRPVDEALKYWVELLYRGNLETGPNLESNLFSGCFGILKVGSNEVCVPWHYGGSFYWFNTKKVVERFDLYNGKMPSQIWNRWFTENFPGWMANENEAEFKLYSSKDHNISCYSIQFWRFHSELLKYLKV